MMAIGNSQHTTRTRRECAALAAFDVRRIVASPFRRCLQTAGVVAATLGVGVVDVDPCFGEVIQ